MNSHRYKILSILLAFCLIIQGLPFKMVFAENVNSSSITIDIGSKSVKIGDTSKVSIKLDKKYDEDSLSLIQICYDVTQETTLKYNKETDTYEGLIKYEVEPECLDIWSIKEIKIGETVLDRDALQKKGLNLENYDVRLGYKEKNYSNSQKSRLKSNINPIIETVYSGYTVVLDPGHGGAPYSGYNWGGTTVVNDTLWEKDYNLDTSLAAAKYLRDLGVNVILTRESDVFLELSERSSFINSVNPDLALSIHHNGYEPQYNGSRTYYKYKEKNGGISKNLAVNVLDSVTSTFNLKKEGAYTETYVDEITGLTFDYLHMIRVPQGNVALVECCYLSNASDQAKVNTKEKRQQMGIAVAKGIQKTLDSMIEKGIKPNTEIKQVQNVRKSSSTSTSITLSWDSISDCTGYKVFKSDNVDGFYYEIGDTKTTSFKDTGLNQGQTYYYKVKAYKDVNGLKSYGKYSSIFSAAGLNLSCDKVLNLSIKDSTEDSITIKWDSVANAVGYEIYRADIESSEYKRILDTGNCEFTDENLAAGKEYFYKVRAYTRYGIYGEYSDAIDFKTLEYELEKVNNLKQDGSTETQIEISWDLVEDAEKYEVYRADTLYGNYEKLAEVEDTEFTDEGLNPNREYFYKVRAYRILDENKVLGELSDVLSAKTSNVECGKIYNLRQDTSVETTITMAWDKADDCSGYKVYKSKTINGKYEEIADITSNTYKDKKLASLSKYYYKVVPYVIFNGEKYLGQESEVLSAYTIRKAEIIVNVYTRATASKDAKKGALLKVGTQVQVVEASDGWYKIRYNDKLVYIASNTATFLYEDVKTMGTTTATSLNVRSGPSVEYEQIGTLEGKQEVIIVLTTSTGWYKIIYNGKYGYVSNSYVVKSKVKAVKGVVTGGINLRTGPSTKYTGIGYLKKGVLVDIVGTASTGWYRVVYNGEIGYASNKYISKTIQKGVATANVNMRKGASTSYDKIYYITKGEEVIILSQAKNGWYEIVYNNKVGYASNKYIVKL